MLDLRKPNDFAASHVPGAYNLPLHSSGPATTSPFSEASVLESQWTELEATFTPARINAHDLIGKDVYVMCYGGDTARVATSVLRARGISASSVKGGYSALRKEIPNLQMSEQGGNLLKQDWLSASSVTDQETQSVSLRGYSEVVVGPP